MLNRRHIRIKVMQSFYALLQSKNDDLKKEEVFLHQNIQKVEELYVLILLLLVEIHDLAVNHLELGRVKHLATSEDKNPNKKFVENKLLKVLKASVYLQDFKKEHKLNNWEQHTEYVRLIWETIKTSDPYSSYIREPGFSFKQDKEFIVLIFKELIAPNEKLFEFLESEHIGWIDDIPLVNTFILKKLSNLKQGDQLQKVSLYRDKDDQDFVKQLFNKTALHHAEFTDDIDEKTPNWDADRIAELDLILIKMALTEFVYFHSIPTKVTINEYIEIAKDYSTTKSSFFINGVLDKISKEYTKSGKIQKIGRGLL